jgi:shikimate kinase
MREDPAPDLPVVVLGLMGAGKTTLAAALADRWGRVLRDSDAEIQQAQGRTAAQIVAARGREALHDLEAAQLHAALSARPAAVLAAAASTVEREDCRTALAGGFVIWIDVPVAELARRQSGGAHRPVYDPDLTAMLTGMDARRRPLFTQVADLVLRPAEAADAAPSALVTAVEAAISALA